MSRLHEWQAVRLSDESWQHDVEQLFGAVERARASRPWELRLGDTFAGHRIEQLIGRGGMGVVYRARHLGLDREGAIKVIAPELARSQEVRERFVRESEVAATIRHPSVLTVHDAGEENALVYLTLQLVEGEDLGSRLRREGRMPPTLTAEIRVCVRERSLRLGVSVDRHPLRLREYRHGRRP